MKQYCETTLTLIELLGVIAIITILSAMLFPVCVAAKPGQGNTYVDVTPVTATTGVVYSRSRHTDAGRWFIEK